MPVAPGYPNGVEASVVAVLGSIHDQLTAGFWNAFLGCVDFLEKCYRNVVPRMKLPDDSSLF